MNEITKIERTDKDVDNSSYEIKSSYEVTDDYGKTETFYKKETVLCADYERNLIAQRISLQDQIAEIEDKLTKLDKLDK